MRRHISSSLIGAHLGKVPLDFRYPPLLVVLRHIIRHLLRHDWWPMREKHCCWLLQLLPPDPIMIRASVVRANNFAQRAINWNALKSKCPDKQTAALINGLQKDVQDMQAKVKFTAAPVAIDWDKYRSVIKTPGLVDELQACYNRDAVPGMFNEPLPAKFNWQGFISQPGMVEKLEELYRSDVKDIPADFKFSEFIKQPNAFEIIRSKAAEARASEAQQAAITEDDLAAVLAEAQEVVDFSKEQVVKLEEEKTRLEGLRATYDTSIQDLVDQFPEKQEEFEWKVHDFDLGFAVDDERVKPPTSE